MACLACVFAPSWASAAWLGYKNDTQAAIVVQTSVVVNDKVVRGKEHKLYPGEIAWDNIPVAGPRQISVMDPKANNKLTGQETINVANQDIFLSVQWQAQPQQPGKAVIPPALRLIPVKLPVPPGVIPPKGDAPKDAPKTGPNTPIPPRSPLPPSATPPSDKPKTPPAEKPKSPPSADQPKTPAEQPKSPPPAEQPKTPPPAEQPKSKSGNDK